MCNELSNKEKKALKSIPIGANANNNQTVKYNSATGKFEFVDFSSFDVNNDYNPTGNWDFNQIPTIGGNPLALRNELANYATAAALTTGLAGKVDNATLANYATTAALTAGLAGKADTSALANYVSKTANETIDGSKTFSQQVNMALGLQLKYQAAPTGAASNTTLYADSTGRLSWRNGTGFTRTFDGTSITANRTWSMPDADTTLAGLGVNQTFTAQQIFTSGTYVAGNSFFGNNTALINSVGKAGFGIATALTATLTAQGDGTNPIARFQDSTNANAISINSTASQIVCNSLIGTSIISLSDRFTFTSGIGSGGLFTATFGNSNNFTTATGNSGILNVNGTFASATVNGNANFRPLNISYTINNTGAQTGTLTGVFLNATETALNGQSHNLMDLQVGGASRMRVSSLGSVVLSASIVLGNSSDLSWNTFSKITSATNGNITLYNNTYNDFNRLQFGGITNAFPSLKRLGTSLETRLADDSGYCNFRANDITGNRIIAGSTIVATAATTAKASLNIPEGTAPTTPIDGDIWFDGTDLYMRVAGANKRFTTTG